jgi:hypothetical protein
MKKPKAPRVTAASASENKLIARWKKLHQQLALTEPQIRAARATLVKVAQAAGADFIQSRFGSIAVRTSLTLDVGELKRQLVDGGYISETALEKLAAGCMKTSDPYVVAPREWGAEVKTADELAAAA